MGAPQADDRAPSGSAENRKRRKYATVLVSIPGWPAQDPGRLMVWTVKTSNQKAARAVKRLQRLMPEYEWSWESLTATEARAIKLKPFSIRVGELPPIECQWTGQRWRTRRSQTPTS